MDEKKIKLREAARAAIDKKYGKRTLVSLNETTDFDGNIQTIGTGILGLDLALGQAIPKGRIIEVYGPESSGKTTLALHIAAEANKQDGYVAFVDAEHALDINYAKAIGVDVENKFDINQPDYGEQALDIAIDLVKSNAYDLIIIDSVAALTPKAEIEGDMGDSHMGLQARMMSQALRKLTSVVAQSQCVVLFINQLRMKIGVMFGNPETTTGGNALKFYASQRIDIRKLISQNEKNKAGEMISNKVKIKIVKNKMAPPFREIILDIEYGKGFSKIGDLIDQAEKYGIIHKSGAWYTLGNKKNIAQGRANMKSYLENNQDLIPKIVEAVHTAYTTGEIIDLEF